MAPTYNSPAVVMKLNHFWSYSIHSYTRSLLLRGLCYCFTMHRDTGGCGFVFWGTLVKNLLGAYKYASLMRRLHAPLIRLRLVYNCFSYICHLPGDGLSWVTDVTGEDKVTGQDLFFSYPLYFFPHSFSSYFFLLFHYLISILLFPSVWENTRAWVIWCCSSGLLPLGTYFCLFCSASVIQDNLWTIANYENGSNFGVDSSILIL